jgi:hypothetical protein
LVTSRNSDAAGRITGNNNRIDIGSMSETESMALLKAKLKHESSDSLELVQALGQIPLAITQAAAYIAKSPTMNITKYLDLFRQSETNQSSQTEMKEICEETLRYPAPSLPHGRSLSIKSEEIILPLPICYLL